MRRGPLKLATERTALTRSTGSRRQISNFRIDKTTTWILVVLSLELLASQPGNIQMQKKLSLDACMTDVSNIYAEMRKKSKVVGVVCMTQPDVSAFVSAADCHNLQNRVLPGGFETTSVDCKGITAGPK
jgi:hypothetical protein